VENHGCLEFVHYFCAYKLPTVLKSLLLGITTTKTEKRDKKCFKLSQNSCRKTISVCMSFFFAAAGRVYNCKIFMAISYFLDSTWIHFLHVHLKL
jgi:hypothetical protein